MAQALIEGDGGRGGQIQRACSVRDGDVVGGGGVAAENGFGKPAGFRTKYKKKPLHLRQAPEGPGAGLGEDRHLGILRRHRRDHFIKAAPNRKIHLPPIVQARPPQLFVVQGKSQRLDQMQPGAYGQTGAADVARVPVNFGIDENHVALWPGSLLQLDAKVHVCY